MIPWYHKGPIDCRLKRGDSDKCHVKVSPVTSIYLFLVLAIVYYFRSQTITHPSLSWLALACKHGYVLLESGRQPGLSVTATTVPVSVALVRAEVCVLVV